jgi:hypothetical protein
VLGLLGPAADARGRQRAKLQQAAGRVAECVALLPPATVEAALLDVESCELPGLAAGADSPTGRFQAGWALYLAAREQELALEPPLAPKWWALADAAGLLRWNQAVRAREEAGRALGPPMRALEEEIRAVTAEMASVSHALAIWAQREVERVRCLHQPAIATCPHSPHNPHKPCIPNQR